MKLRKFLCLFAMALSVFVFSGCGGSSNRKIVRDNTDSPDRYKKLEAGNALLIEEGSPTFENIFVYKSGDATGENYDKDGNNAAILVRNGATPTFTKATISSDAKGANAVFSYGGNLGISSIHSSATGDGTKILIQNSQIDTYGNNSGGIMVTGGGRIEARSLNINTYGQSSAAIRSDQGGGEIIVEKGTYTTNGQGSPAIYSTADITVTEADLEATSSQGVVIEGNNSVNLDLVNVTANHKTLNGQDSTHQAVLIYQSGSGDASEGKATFTMKNGTIDNAIGDIFCVTNTDAEINLTDISITNKDSSGNFLRAEAQKWGRYGGNGGKVALNAINQAINGNIVVDDKSSLTMTLNEGSNFRGTITTGKTGKTEIFLDADSTWTLTGDSKVTVLSGDGAKAVNYGVYSLDIDNYSYNASIPYDPDVTVSRDISATEARSGYHAIVHDTGSYCYDNVIVTKTGDLEESEAAYNYGANAAVLSSGDSSIILKSSTITSNAAYASAVFANGGKITIFDGEITTTGNNSDGLTAANGGNITASKPKITTSGTSSAGMRMINGGEIKLTGGTVESEQGVVVDGGNTVTLKDVTLTANQAILISGDAKKGTATLNIEGGSISAEDGDSISVKNSTCTINISDKATITQKSGHYLLNVSNTTDKKVTLNIAEGQTVQGDIAVNSDAILDINLKRNAIFIGTINSKNAGTITLNFTEGSKVTLTGESHVYTTSGPAQVDGGYTLFKTI